MGPSFSPLADALDLGPSGYSPWLVEGAVRLGAARAFAPAADLLRHFTGVTMHPATVRRLSEAAGGTMRQLELACTEAAWAAGAQATGEAAPTVPLQLSLDGSMVARIAEGWHEVKLAAIGERTADGLTALSYTATLGDAAAFGQEALGELVRRGVPQADDVVTVNDGAEWIQGFLDLHCPQAQRVLDFAHAAGYLATAANAVFGEGTAAAQTWFATQRHELRQGDPDIVLAALAALPPSAERDQATGYLMARRHQIAYRDFAARGWPRGSGCVESAPKGIVQARLKGPGMRWGWAGAAALLVLGVVEANDRWAETWPQVGGHQRAAQRARTATRRAARRHAPPRPKLVQHGKPTAAHPWRTFRLPGSPPAAHTM